MTAYAQSVAAIKELLTSTIMRMREANAFAVFSLLATQL
jgi:hypothetical protein